MAHPGGRPTKLTPTLLEGAHEYMRGCIDEHIRVSDKNGYLRVNIPTIEGLALALRIRRSTVYEWTKTSQEFSDIVEDILTEQSRRLVQGGLSGSYNPTIAKLMMSKHGYREETAVDHTTKGEKIASVGFAALPNEELERIAAEGASGVGEEGAGTSPAA